MTTHNIIKQPIAAYACQSADLCAALSLNDVPISGPQIELLLLISP